MQIYSKLRFPAISKVYTLSHHTVAMISGITAGTETRSIIFFSQMM